MTPDDAQRMAAAIGLSALTSEQLARLAALAANTDAQVAKLPRLAKHVAPASVFVVPPGGSR
jgi:hypothetical protein